MSEPPDKTRVIRLVKKRQQAPNPPASTSPPEPRSKTVPSQQRQPDSRWPQKQRPPWKKGPFQKRQQPGRPRVPPQPKPALVVLTEEQKEKILDLYRNMVVTGERPPEGRRKTIAALLGVPYANVASVVRSYVTHERYRRTNFDIEKLYWQFVRAGETNARAIAGRITAQLGLEEGRIWWWLEKLHEPRHSFAHDPEVEEEKQAAILTRYEDYLLQPEPPEKGLHQFLAEQVGDLTPRQVHRILWEYRVTVWKSLEGTTSESAPSGESTSEDG